MSQPNYRCLNCGVFAEIMPDDDCPNCDGPVEDYISISPDFEEEARGEAQFEAARDKELG